MFVITLSLRAKPKQTHCILSTSLQLIPVQQKKENRLKRGPSVSVQAARSSRLQEDLQPSTGTKSFRFMPFRHRVSPSCYSDETELATSCLCRVKLLQFIINTFQSRLWGTPTVCHIFFNPGWVFFCCILFISKTRIMCIYEGTSKRFHLGIDWFFLQHQAKCTVLQRSRRGVERQVLIQIDQMFTL